MRDGGALGRGPGTGCGVEMEFRRVLGSKGGLYCDPWDRSDFWNWRWLLVFLVGGSGVDNANDRAISVTASRELVRPTIAISILVRMER